MEAFDVCNEWAQERAWKAYCEEMARQEMSIISTEPPTLPLGSMKPSDPAPIILGAPGGSRLEVIPWGWKPRVGKGLVINVRSEGRKDPPSARGIAIFDRFYEHRDDGGKLKSKFAFSPAANEPMALAVVVRDGRYALVTGEPGPDVAFVHHRTPVTLRAANWVRYLTDLTWPDDLMAPPPSGTLKSIQVR